MLDHSVGYQAQHWKVPKREGYPLMTPEASTMVVIRRAQPRDMRRVRSMLIYTWHAAYDGLMGVAEVDRRCAELFKPVQLMQSIHDTSGHWFGLVEKGGILCGVATVRFMALGRAKIEMLYILPAYQRSGIATALLAHIATEMPWAHVLDIEVLEFNHGAIAFYRSQGFRSDGVSQRDWSGQRVLAMQLTRKKPSSIRSSYARFRAKVLAGPSEEEPSGD